MFELSAQYQNPHLPLQFGVSLVQTDASFDRKNQTDFGNKGGKYFLKIKIVKAKPFFSVYIQSV